MKRCPKCNVGYFDNMLEYCLEDGTRLTNHLQTARADGATTEAYSFPRMAEPTAILGKEPVPDTIDSPSSPELETVDAKRASMLPGTGTAAKVLEITPIVLALAHNWWQWLYLENQYVSSIASYIFSANFLMWLLLLVSGVFISLWSAKQSERKTIAYASLIVFAINLILYIVPRR